MMFGITNENEHSFIDAMNGWSGKHDAQKFASFDDAIDKIKSFGYQIIDKEEDNGALVLCANKRSETTIFVVKEI